MNNDIDKNSTDNKNNNKLNISKIQLLSSPPKSDNSDLQKEFKEPDPNNEIRIESKYTTNENEDWEVVDMDIDDDDGEVIQNPKPNIDSNVNISVIYNNNSGIIRKGK